MRLHAPRNLMWKIGSVVLAFFLWATMAIEPDVVTTHVTQVLYQNLPGEYIVAGDAPDSLRVELRGPSGQLTPGVLQDTVLLVDLAGASGPGERTVTISSADLNLPRSVTFLRAVPSQFRVRLARLTNKQVPVHVQLLGALPNGFQLKSSSVSPDHIQIAGAEDRVAEVSVVETDPIDLRSVRQSGDYRVNAFVANPRVRFTSDPGVTVSIAVTAVPGGAQN